MEHHAGSEVDEEEVQVAVHEGWSAAVAEVTTEEAERVRGSFLGLAWGDVHGCPIEGWRPASIQKVYGDYNNLPSEYPLEEISAVGKGYMRKLRPIGLYSDDTQQCMILIQCCLCYKDKPAEAQPGDEEQHEDERPTKEDALANTPNSSVAGECQVFKPPPKGMGRVRSGPGPEVRVEWNALRWGRTLAVMFRRDALRDYGRHFKEAVAKLNHNIPPHQSGSKGEGMGAAMRIGALGALFRDDLEGLAACAWESSFTTHAPLHAAATSYAVSYAVACLVRGMSVAEVREKLPGAVAAKEEQWLLDPGKWEIWASSDNCHLISHCLRTAFTNCDLTDHAGHVLLGGMHGLIMALLPDIEPQRVLRDIVVLGYDTDTVGAICGTVMGARFGTGWIPLHLMLERERLLTYADALVTAGRAEDKRRPPELESLEELIEREAKLTAWGTSVKLQNGLGKEKPPYQHQQQREGKDGAEGEGDGEKDDGGRNRDKKDNSTN